MEVARLSREHCRKRNESKRPTTFVRVFEVTQRDKPPELDKNRKVQNARSYAEDLENSKEQ